MRVEAPAEAPVDTVERILGEIEAYAREYMEIHGETMRSSLIAQRYAKRIKRLTGQNVRDFVVSSGRFYTSISKSGALLVSAKVF